MTYPGGSPLHEYLEARIERADSGCWLWTGHLIVRDGSDSYGLACHRDLSPRRAVAHRAVYEHHIGPIAEGLQLDHLCRVRRCVNPDHLEPVTQQENIRRQNAAQTHCKNGHPFDEVNTYVTRQGHRQCRACKNERQKQRYRRLRAIAQQIGVAA